MIKTGYAVIMFGVLLITSVIMVTAFTYGIAKDSQIAPLKAENMYTERETGKAQTGITIVETCLAGVSRYTDAQPGEKPLILNLTIRNNGSIVLNQRNLTVLYNASYYSNFNVTSQRLWAPLTNTTLEVRNLFISPVGAGPELMLLVAAENGIPAIAPTTPINFTGYFDKPFDVFSWNASKDARGIDYYLIYRFEIARTTCSPMPPPHNFKMVAGNITSTSFFVEGPPYPARFYFMTAVDLDGNMAIQSRTLKCPGASGACKYE